MKRVLTILLLLLMAAGEDAFAQARRISGRILDETGAGLPGAGITVKGTSTGTVTDVDGNFSIDMPEGSTVLMIQSIGYTTQSITPSGDNITVRLTPSSKELEGTVVTALGISRERKQLGYTVNSVSGDQITRSGEQNISQALAAKAPGVVVTQSSGTPGASSKIVLRGYSGYGENQPLFVVDGVPIDNGTNVQVAGDYPFNQNLSGVNESNRALDINPNDVESISILKGPAAASLYGERGGNGAVIITTKRGKYGAGKGLGITYNSSVEISSVNKLPKLQRTYAQGNGGVYSTFDPGPDGILDTGDDIIGTPNSWGPRIDTTSLHSYNNEDAFFQKGVSYFNDLSISGGNDFSIFRLGISNLNQKGIIPNSSLKRTTVRLNAETKPSDWLTVGTSINYSYTEGQRVQNGSNLAGTMLTLLRAPASTDITKYYDASRNQEIRYYTVYDNPLFSAKYNPYNDYTNRVFGNVYGTAKFLKNFNATLRVGTDAYNTRARQVYALSSLGNDNGDGLGQMNISSTNYLQVYSDFIIRYEKALSSKFDVNAFVGYNYWYEESRFDFSRGRNIIIPGLYNLGNTTELYASNSESYQLRDAFFGDVTLGYDRQLYLTLTGRAEKSTTLGQNSNRYFYPKGDIAWVFSEIIPQNNILGFGKVRFAYASAATSPGTYTDRNYFVQPFITDGNTNGNAFPYLGQIGYSANNINYPGGLKPQFVDGLETGLELRFAKNRITFEGTYYVQNSRNLLLEKPVSPSSGYAYQYTNAATLQNKGVELSLGADILKDKDFTWNIVVNWSKNVSLVKSLANGVKEVNLETGFADIASYTIVGQPFGVFYGTAWQRDAQGRLLLDEDGKPSIQATNQRLGNPNPDWLMNINNSFTYKGLSFTFLWDIRHGGDIWNGTYARLTRLGRTDITEDRNRDFVIDGVYAPGTSKAGQQNTTPVSAQYYYQTFKGDLGNYAAENAIQDGSWVRLRQVGISYRYNFPSNTTFKYLELGVSGRNLLLFTKYKGVDPETTLTGAGSNIFGYDYFNNPGTKSVMITLRAGL